MNRTCLILLSALALCGCSKDSGEGPSENSGVAICPQAGIGTLVDSKASVEGSKFAKGDNVFRMTGYRGTAAPATTWQTTYFKDVQVNCTDANGSLALQSPQYYPASGDKLWFYAWAPYTTSLTDGSGSTPPQAVWTITGQEDIMWSKAGPSDKNGNQPAFTFDHKLMQVKFKVQKDDSFQSTTAKVTSIKITGVKTRATLNLGTGVLTFSGNATGTLSAYSNSTGVTLGTTAADVPGNVMFEPQKTFNCEVVAEGVTYSNIAVTLAGNAAGTSYVVTLTFKQQRIDATASIAAWNNVTTTDDIEVGPGNIQ